MYKFLLNYILIFFTAFQLVGCKVSDLKVSAPTVGTSGSNNRVNFNHDLFATASCVQCHENKRPITIPLHGNGGDCINCHTPNVNSSGVRSWINVTSYNHLPAPQTCMNCHNAKRPTNISPHKTGQLGNKDDCYSCHTYPNWKTAKFDHTKPVTNCIECHRNEVVDHRPIPKTSHPAATNAELDCILCHNNSTNNKKWTDYTFTHKTHSPNPSSCLNCHETKRPLSHTINPSVTGMDKADCLSCHTSTSSWAVHSAFNHETAAPTSCVGCHSQSLPKTQSAHPSINLGYNKMDCVKCHTYDQSTSARSWTKIVFNHRSHSPMPNSCNECHKTINDSRPVSGSHNVGGRTKNDCAVCHSYDVTKAWTSFANFNHIALDTNETCTSCHNPTIKTLRSKPSTHITTSLDCKSCHTSTAWKPANYAHSTSDTNCMSCHNGAVATGKPASHTLSGQCNACHTQASWAKSFNTTYAHTNNIIPISNGIKHPAVTTCSNCHSATSDSVSWRYTTTSTKATVNPKGTCAGCHQDKYNDKHGVLNSTTKANCLSCHDHSNYKF